MPTYAARASNVLSAHLEADGFSGWDPATLLPILMDLLAKLIGCQPTPAAGYAYLTWRPYQTPRFLDWLFGSPADRLANYRNKVNAAITAQSVLTVARRDAFVTGLWTAVDAGELTTDMMTGLYQEAKR